METTENSLPGSEINYPRGVTFEQVWALIQESSKKSDRMTEEIKALQKETAAIQKETSENMKETDRKMKETDKQMKETFKRLDDLGVRFGDLGNRFGELAEHLVAPGIATRFNEMGYKFDSYVHGSYKIFDEKGKIRTEIDMLLENGDHLIAVELKTKPVMKDVEHHIRRLEILREHRSKHRDDRKIQGAIAGAVFGSEVKRATIEAGLFVIEQSGDTMKIEVPEGFLPRDW